MHIPVFVLYWEDPSKKERKATESGKKTLWPNVVCIRHPKWTKKCSLPITPAKIGTHKRKGFSQNGLKA